MRTLSIFLCLVLSCGLALSQQQITCPVDPASLSNLNEMLHNPPKNWNNACITKKLLDDFLNDRTHVPNVLVCMEDIARCKAPGYKLIADGIFDALPTGDVCITCFPKEVRELVRYGQKRLQKEYREAYIKGLSLLG